MTGQQGWHYSRRKGKKSSKEGGYAVQIQVCKEIEGRRKVMVFSGRVLAMVTLVCVAGCSSAQILMGKVLHGQTSTEIQTNSVSVVVSAGETPSTPVNQTPQITPAPPKDEDQPPGKDATAPPEDEAQPPGKDATTTPPPEPPIDPKRKQLRFNDDKRESVKSTPQARSFEASQELAGAKSFLLRLPGSADQNVARLLALESLRWSAIEPIRDLSAVVQGNAELLEKILTFCKLGSKDPDLKKMASEAGRHSEKATRLLKGMAEQRAELVLKFELRNAALLARADPDIPWTATPTAKNPDSFSHTSSVTKPDAGTSTHTTYDAAPPKTLPVFRPGNLDKIYEPFLLARERDQWKLNKREIEAHLPASWEGIDGLLSSARVLGKKLGRPGPATGNMLNQQSSVVTEYERCLLDLWSALCQIELAREVQRHRDLAGILKWHETALSQLRSIGKTGLKKTWEPDWPLATDIEDKSLDHIRYLLGNMKDLEDAQHGGSKDLSLPYDEGIEMRLKALSAQVTAELRLIQEEYAGAVRHLNMLKRAYQP